MSYVLTKFVELCRSGVLRVDCDGAVYRCVTFTRAGRAKAIAPERCDHLSTTGYRAVRVGRKLRVSAHRLVWTILKGDIPIGLEPNHKNGNKADNHPLNLELLTHGKNIEHAYRVLKSRNAAGENNAAAKLSPAQAQSIRDLQGRATSRVVGSQFGVSHRQVLNIWNGKHWTSNRKEIPA